MNLESLNCWRSNRRLGFIWRRHLIVSHIISIQNVYFPISTIGNIWHTLNECNRQFQLPIQLTHGTKLPQKKRKYLKTFVKCFSGVDQTKIIWCHINRINMSKPPSTQNWNRCKAFFRLLLTGRLATITGARPGRGNVGWHLDAAASHIHHQEK